MRRSRRRFENRWSWFGCFLMRVITVKGGEIDRKLLQDGVPNASLISDQVFVLNVWIAHLPDQHGNTIGAGKSGEVQAVGGVQTSRSASGSRYRCPEHFMITRWPRNAGARQQHKPGVVIVLQLSAYREVESVG